MVDGLADSTAFAERMLRDAGVAVTPGVAFGASGEGYIRVCFAANEALLSEALRRLRGFMSARAAQGSEISARPAGDGSPDAPRAEQ